MSIVLTVGRDKKGGLLAIISDGSPQLGDEEVTILSVKVVKNKKAAREWFKRMTVERPWEERN